MDKKNPSDLLRRSLAAIWHPCSQMQHYEAHPPVAIGRGEGAWLIDVSGRRYLDAISSWWVNLFGHSNPRINAAIADQLGKIEHLMLAGFTHEPAVQLAERLSQRAAGLGHCFFASDGASAVEIALKMSFHYWANSGAPAKNGFISLRNSYHGETLGALSVGDTALFKKAYAPLLRASAQLPTPDWRDAQTGETAPDFAERCAQALEHYLEQHHATTAAFIVEPLVQGAAGMAMYAPNYLARARETCTRYDVHLIADEIAVGFGRSGTFFACEQAAIRPDFLCLSKGISGGYLPLSMVLTSDAVYQAFYDAKAGRGFLHSHSYSGNPLACRAALATLDIFDSDDVIHANRAKAEYMRRAIEQIAQLPHITHVRQTGMIAAFDVADAGVDFSARFAAAAMQRSVVLRPIGNSVYFMPPYVVSESDIDFLVDATIAALLEVRSAG